MLALKNLIVSHDPEMHGPLPPGAEPQEIGFGGAETEY
jgi:hypothetical protein